MPRNSFATFTWLEREGVHMRLVSEPVLGADEKAAHAAVIDSVWVTMGDRWHRRLSATPAGRERGFIT
jgi:hypothetical protein